MSAKSAGEAIANANGYTSYESGMCLKWVRGPCWEVAAVAGDAQEAWDMARHKHPGDRNPPDGAPVFWSGGSKGYGHVAIWRESDMRSTDCKSTGKVSAAPLSWTEDTWGFRYLGWTSDLNGVDLPIESDDMALSNDDLDRIADAVWKRLLEGQDSAPEGRYAAATLSGVRNLCERIARKVGA